VYIPAVSALPDVEKRCPIDLSCTRSKGIDLQGFRYVADAIEPVGFCKVQVYPYEQPMVDGATRHTGGFRVDRGRIPAEADCIRFWFCPGFLRGAYLF
jgi:hypothetical protein